jgi:hypothetical protein
MLNRLLDAVRADVDQQVGWATLEVQRQTRHVAVVVAFALCAALAAMAAAVVGLIALYTWLASVYGQATAFALLGGGLALIALIFLVLFLTSGRPRVAARPSLRVAQPAALLDTVTEGRSTAVMTAGEDALNVATDALKNGSRTTIFGAIALAVVVGAVAGRTLKVEKALGEVSGPPLLRTLVSYAITAILARR